MMPVGCVPSPLGSRIITVDALVTALISEPITLAEVKQHLRWTTTNEDVLITTYITAARQYFETETGRQLLTATWDYGLDAAPLDRELELPHPPLQSVASVIYDDTVSPALAMDPTTYRVVAPQGPTCPRGRIVLNAGTSWPVAARRGANGWRVRYVAGYGSNQSDVPTLIKVALYLLVGLFHQHRSEVQNGTIAPLPIGAAAIVRQFKYTALGTTAVRRSA